MTLKDHRSLSYLRTKSNSLICRLVQWGGIYWRCLSSTIRHCVVVVGASVAFLDGAMKAKSGKKVEIESLRLRLAESRDHDMAKIVFLLLKCWHQTSSVSHS